MRNRFDEQLFELNREIIEMGAMCEEAIASAVKALTHIFTLSITPTLQLVKL